VGGGARLPSTECGANLSNNGVCVGTHEAIVCIVDLNEVLRSFPFFKYFSSNAADALRDMVDSQNHRFQIRRHFCGPHVQMGAEAGSSALGVGARVC